MTRLPPLQTESKQYPDCSLSLSPTILDIVLKELPHSDEIVLSIGSGSGLFEAYLKERQPSLQIEGVEVAHSVNKYLPEECINIVQGTWALSRRAQDCCVLLFVYPRSVDLVRQYLEALDNSPKLRTILWIGPPIDWSDFRIAFEGSSFTICKNIIELSPYEIMVRANRQMGISSTR